MAKNVSNKQTPKPEQNPLRIFLDKRIPAESLEDFGTLIQVHKVNLTELMFKALIDYVNYLEKEIYRPQEICEDCGKLEQQQEIEHSILSFIAGCAAQDAGNST